MTTSNIASGAKGPPALDKSARPGRRFRFTTAHIAAAIGILLILGLVFTAIFADQLSPYDPQERVGIPFEVPSATHRLGTNDIGQDILSELIYGTRVSLTVGFAAALVAILLGTSVGLLAGYYSSLESFLMRIVDIILVIPFLPLLI
ncbi:MAG: hypothetical protein R3335_09110, partial [Anaerolineales bacterium]|nr:hypothetical protein [Anaerolineales bacterium]